MTITLTATNSAWKGEGKPYVAALTGLDRKFGFVREFMPRTAHITDPGLFEVRNFDKKDRPDTTIYLVLPVEGELKKIAIRDETAAEILKAARPVTDLIPHHDADGKLRIRANGIEGPLSWSPGGVQSDEAKRGDLDRLLQGYIKPDDIGLDHRAFLAAIVERIKADL